MRRGAGRNLGEEMQPTIDVLRQKTARSLASLAMFYSSFLHPSQSIDSLTVATPAFIQTGCDAPEHSTADLAQLAARAKNDNKPTSKDNGETNDDAPVEVVGLIEERTSPKDYVEVAAFELPNYSLDVVIKSDADSMQHSIDHQALEELVVWPYKNAELFERKDGETHELDRASLHCVMDFIERGNFSRPLTIVLPQKFREMCKSDDEFVFPAVNCTADAATFSGDFGSLLFYSEIMVTTGRVANRNHDNTLRRILAHEINHFLLRQMYSESGVQAPDPKIREAIAYDIQAFVGANLDNIPRLLTE